MLALVRFLRAFFAAAEDSESLITDSRTLIAGYTKQQRTLIIGNLPILIIAKCDINKN